MPLCLQMVVGNLEQLRDRQIDGGSGILNLRSLDMKPNCLGIMIHHYHPHSVYSIYHPHSVYSIYYILTLFTLYIILTLFTLYSILTLFTLYIILTLFTLYSILTLFTLYIILILTLLIYLHYMRTNTSVCDAKEFAFWWPGVLLPVASHRLATQHEAQRFKSWVKRGAEAWIE